MALLRQQRDPARIFLRRLGLLALLVAVIFAGSSVWGVYKKERESAVLRAQAESEHADLLERETRLKEDIAKLNTDRGMEEILREQYSLAEEGEGLIVIVEPASSETSQATSSPSSNWFQRVLEWWK